MKKFLLGFIVGAAIMIPVTAFGQTAVENIQAYLNPNVNITVNGETLELESTPIIYEQTTYLPLREVSEKVMGMTVGWDQETSTVELTTEDAWPTTDITEEVQTIEGDEVKTKDDVTFRPDYLALFEKDETLSIDEINEKIRLAKINLRQYNEMIEYEESYPGSFKAYIIEAYRDEIPKLEEIVTYWQSLKDQKEAESKQEQ